MKFSLCIASYNEGEWLKRTVDSLIKNAQDVDFEIVVIDDGSNDQSADFIKDKTYEALKQQGVLKLNSTSGLGVGGARHKAVEHATGDILVFLDAHMETEAKWLFKISEILKKNPEVHILGIQCHDFPITAEVKNNPTFSIYTNDDSAYYAPNWIQSNKSDFKESIINVPFVNAANFIIRKEVYEATGGFPRFIKGWGSEDRYLTQIAYYMGYNTYVCKDIHIWHKYAGPGMLTKEQISRKQNLVYNAIVISYVLYPDNMFKEVIEDLSRVTKTVVPESQPYKDFLEVKKDLSKVKKEISSKSVRAFSEFEKEFSDYLSYLKVKDYFLSINNKETLVETKRTKLLKNVLQTKYGYGYYILNELKAAVKFQLSEIYKEKDKTLSHKFLEESYNLNPISLVALLYLAINEYQEKNYKKSISLLSSALYLLESNSYCGGPLYEGLNAYVSKTGLLDWLSNSLQASGQYIQAYNTGKELIKLETQDERIKNNFILYKNSYINTTPKKSISIKEVSFKVKYDAFQGYWNSVEEGSWEIHTFEVIKKYVNKETNFFDIGAWIGPTTLFASPLAKTVYSFEPDPFAYSELELNTEINKPVLGNIKLFQAAVTNTKDAWGVLSSHGKNWNTSASSLMPRENEEKIICKLIHLPEFIINNGIYGNTFFKIDIEGFEYKLIPDLVSSEIVKSIKPIIYLSIHSPWYENENQNLKKLFYYLSEFYSVRNKENNEFRELQSGFYEVICLPR